MKLICTQENLNRILSYLEKVAGKQLTLPILSNFLLETENGRLKISATNLEIGIIGYIGAKIENEGKIAIPAKVLSNFIHNLPSGDVLDLEATKQGLKIVSTTYQTIIKGLDGKDFPIIPEYKEEYFFSFPAQEFKKALSHTLFCMSVNNARLELTGVHIFFYEDRIELAATDSFRLAEEIIPLSHQKEDYHNFLIQNPSLIIPGSTLHEIMHIITPESTDVKIALKENQIFFEIDGIQIISRIINGKYPDYKQIIPKNFALQVVLEKESFQRAVKIASNFASYNIGEITLSFLPEEKQCIISSESQEIGTNQTILPIEIQNSVQPLKIVFNPRYILEGINTLTSDFLLFSANTESTPIALKAYTKNTEENNYMYIVMPIRK